MTFGNYLRELREGRFLRQIDLANGIGVSTVYVCDIEKGRRYPPGMEKLRMWAVQMSLSSKETAHFYDLAGEARDSAPPDITEYLELNPAARDAIRRIMGQKQEYNWNTISPRR